MAKDGKRGGSSLGFILGILFGIAVGILLAILFAPQSGEETRGKLNSQSDEMRKRYQEALDQGREAYGRAREEVMTRMKQQS